MKHVFIIEFIDKFFNSNTVAVIAGALIAGWFGFKKYRSQKIWEKIDERYFKKGIEELIEYLQYIRSTVEHNHSYFLQVLKYFSAIDNNKFLEWFDGLKDIKETNALSAKMPNSYLITVPIFKNKYFGKLCINLFIHISIINDYFVSDGIICIYTAAKEPEKLPVSKEQFCKRLKLKGNERFQKIYKELDLYGLIEMLENALFILRKQNINSYKKLEKVHQNKEIIKLLKKLENIKEIKNEKK